MNLKSNKKKLILFRSVIIKIKSSIYLDRLNPINDYNENNLKNINYELGIKLKNRYFLENQKDTLRNFKRNEENIFSFNINDDLYLTETVSFSINRQ